MTPIAKSEHSASQALTGYIYQCRIALLETLTRLRIDPQVKVSIETLDDVVFHNPNNTTDVIQVKHHQSPRASLTNASVDLWKSINVWIDLFCREKSNSTLAFCLMTTAEAKKDSAPYFLRAENRDIPRALKSLRHTALSSSNKANKAACEKFMGLPDQKKNELFDSVYVMDIRPLNENLEDSLKKALWGWCSRDKVEVFIQYFEGWWFKQIVKHLSESNLCSIEGATIDAQLDYLREQFRQDSLPIHSDLSSSNIDVPSFETHVFLKQLDLIGVNKNRTIRAAKQYYQASEQRSRWVREDLLLNQELEIYDDKLVEEWNILFEQILDIIIDSTNEKELIESGRKIFKWVEMDANIPVRKSPIELFVTRGSYHILANQLKVGWHPDYRNRLASMQGKN